MNDGNCSECGKSLYGRRKNAIVCSLECKNRKDARRRSGEPEPNPALMADAPPVRSRAATASVSPSEVQRQLIADLERRADELRQRLAADLTATLTAVADKVRQQLVADVDRLTAAATATIRNAAVPVAAANAVPSAEFQRIVAESEKRFLGEVAATVGRAVQPFEQRLRHCEDVCAQLPVVEAYALSALGATGAPR
jgi:hypothetical protein